jgi:hypothetical protein
MFDDLQSCSKALFQLWNSFGIFYAPPFIKARQTHLASLNWHRLVYDKIGLYSFLYPLLNDTEIFFLFLMDAFAL